MSRTSRKRNSAIADSDIPRENEIVSADSPRYTARPAESRSSARRPPTFSVLVPDGRQIALKSQDCRQQHLFQSTTFDTVHAVPQEILPWSSAHKPKPKLPKKPNAAANADASSALQNAAKPATQSSNPHCHTAVSVGFCENPAGNTRRYSLVTITSGIPACSLRSIHPAGR